MDFDELMLCDAVRRGVQAAGFSKATPVQEQVIPKALEGNDLLVFAETGTGKTAAYGLPILERLSRVLGADAPPEPPSPSGEKPPESSADADVAEPAAAPRRPAAALHALILGPTRETVTRAEGALRTLGQFFPARIRAIFGGVPAAPQREALRRGLHIVAATPGRLAEILRQEPLALDQVEVLVLDELDHMAQMNLMGDVLSIVERIPAQRQTFAFAGKRTADLDALAARFLREPHIVEIQSSAPAISEVRQVLYPVDSLQKSDLMVELLRSLNPPKAVIFFRTRRNVDRLQPLVEQLGRRVVVLHADRTPAQRQAAIEAFTSNEAEILLATEMAVRSLEVEGITHLVNYDLPQFPDDYLNRITRCSNLAPINEVLTLVSPEDRDALRRLEKHLAKSIERVKLSGFNYSDRGRRNVDRILAPLGEHRTGVAGEPRKSPRAKPTDIAAKKTLATEEVVGIEPSVPSERSAPPPPAAASAPVPTAGLRPYAHISRPVPNAHFTERLSGRLIRSAAETPAPASPAATSEGAVSPDAPVPTLPVAAPAAPSAPPAPPALAPEPESLATKTTQRMRPTLADEVRHPRALPPRPEPQRTPPPPPSPPPPPPQRVPTPLPVTAAPALAPSEVPEAERSAASKSYPTASFTPSRKEEPPARSRTPYRHPRKAVQPEWVEEVMETELANGEEPHEEEAETEEVAASPDSRAAAPADGRGRGGRPGHGGDRRPPRRIRSWDLHRGGLLDPPPLLSTPYDTFLAEERQARKRDSQIQSEEERFEDFPSEMVVDEPLPTEGAGILPIDWDHPVSRHGRIGRMIVAWKKKMATLQALQGTPAPVQPGVSEGATGRQPKPLPIAAAHPPVVSAAPPSISATQKKGLSPPALPAWPMAADSATSAATAPGPWWTPSPEPQEQPAAASPSEPVKASALSREQSSRRGRGRGRSRYFRKESERPASVPAEQKASPQPPAAASAPTIAPAPAIPPPPPPAPPAATPREVPARPASRVRKAAGGAARGRRGAAAAGSKPAKEDKPGAAEKAAPSASLEKEKTPAKRGRRPAQKPEVAKAPTRFTRSAPVAAASEEKKKPGRKPAAKEIKAPEKAATGEKKKPGRKPAAKESKTPVKNTAPGATGRAKKR